MSGVVGEAGLGFRIQKSSDAREPVGWERMGWEPPPLLRLALSHLGDFPQLMNEEAQHRTRQASVSTFEFQ